MNTISSTLGLFALKSFVSVLPEMKKETALKIVGGRDVGSTGGGGTDLGYPPTQDFINDVLNEDCHNAGLGDWLPDESRCDDPPQKDLPNEPQIPDVPSEPEAPKDEEKCYE